jgi:hypothetical protein
MTYILSCSCESKHGGFPSEWDSESRECEPAVSYGSLCEKHFSEYEARPAQYTAPRELSNDEIMDVWINTGHPIDFAKAILKKASEK